MPVHPLPGFFQPFSAIVHLVAAGVFFVLGYRLVRCNCGERFRTVVLALFAASAVFMLSMSGVFHMLHADGVASSVMRRLDMAAIFVLIAGTFTAVHGMYFMGMKRLIGLMAMWAAAITGLTLTVIFGEAIPSLVSMLLFVLLGWLAGVHLAVMWWEGGARSVWLCVAGGVAYTGGVLVLVLRWPYIIPGVVGPHEVWHVAVLIGLSLQWRFVSDAARTNAWCEPRCPTLSPSGATGATSYCP